MHNLFRLTSLASLEGYFYKPRMDRELLATYADGLIATTGCPGGEVQTLLRLGRYDEALASAAEFRDLFGAGNYYVELMDHGLNIEQRTRADLLRIARELKLPLVATNDLHYTPQSDAAAHEVLLCVQSASTMADAGRFKFEGDGYYLKSPAEMRALFAELPEACDNTLAIAERCEVAFSEGNGTYMPRYPCPPGESEESWFVKEVQAGPAPALPGRHPGRGAAAGRVRDRGDHLDGLRRLLPRGGRLHQLGQGARHPGRSGPRLGRRVDGGVRDADHRPRPAGARADLRALPQPRPGLDAGLRHRLRRASAGRGDPLRHREVRRGPGQPDRHLRHDQGQAGGQGRVPRARLPLRHGGEADQGDAGPGDGQGRAAGQDLRPRGQAVRRGRGVPRSLRVGLRRQDGGGHGPRPGGAEAAVGGARGRGDHVLRSADRHHPDHAPGAGRRDHHPVRLPDLRVARPDQDGLPRAAQPDRARRRGGQHPAQPRLRAGAGGPAAGRRGRRTRCSAVATPSGCSSSTAARCARCSG